MAEENTTTPVEPSPSLSGFVFPIKASATLDRQETEGGQPVFYYWREMAYPGQFTHPLTGQKLDFPESRIQHWAQTAKEELSGTSLSASRRIPLNADHIKFSDYGRGEMVDVKIDGRKLLGQFKIVGDKNRDIFLNNSLSVGIEPEVKGSNGQVWTDAIDHVAITQIPVLGGMDGPVAASASPIFLSATSLTGAYMDGMIPCSATCLSALRGHAHLNMAAVPEGGVMEHMHNHHNMVAAHLSAIKRNVPGMVDCVPGMEMSAIEKGTKVLADKVAKILPNSTNLSAVDFERAVDAKLTELSAASTKIATSDATIASQAQKITELQKQVVEPVTKKEAAMTLSTLKMMGEQAIKDGYPPVFVNAMIELAGTVDKPNNLMLSAAANPGGDGTFGPLVRVFELMRLGKPTPNLGVELSGYQGVHREAPGASLSQETKDLAKEMREQAAKASGKAA